MDKKTVAHEIAMTAAKCYVDSNKHPNSYMIVSLNNPKSTYLKNFLHNFFQ